MFITLTIMQNLKYYTWHDVPVVAPTVGTWPLEVSKHDGVVLEVSQVLASPHMHMPSVGLSFIPEAVHLVLSVIAHTRSLLFAHTHFASLPPLGGLQIGVKSPHP